MPVAPSLCLTPAVQVISQRPCQLGESPLWHPVTQQLFWVDIAGQAIVRQATGGVGVPGAPGEQRWLFDDQPACLAPTSDGDLIVGVRHGVARFRPNRATSPSSGQTSALSRLANAPWDTATTRSNDGRCDPAGRFWTGTVFEPKTSNAAALYCLQAGPVSHASGVRDAIDAIDSSEASHAIDPGAPTREPPPRPGQWTLHAILHDNLTANGLAFDAQRGLAWWSNTPAHVIHQYPYDVQRGTFGQPSVFHQFTPRQEGEPYGGRPDGACLDSAGHYWVAMYEGGRVLRLAPDGSVALELRLPVTCPTMVCLGGNDLRTLFITTASKGRPAAELAREPLAGHVLAVALATLPLPADLRGVPADLFAERN